MLKSVKRKYILGLLFLILALAGFTFFGYFIRIFTYFFFTGTSAGKTIAFFAFAAFVFLKPDLSNNKKIPGKLKSAITNKKLLGIVFFSCIAILLAIGFLGLVFVFQENVYSLNIESPNLTKLFFYQPEGDVKINWLGFTHNHYLKPMLTPLLLMFKELPFDTGLPLYGEVSPLLISMGILFLILALISLILFLENYGRKDNLKKFLFTVSGFGLLLGAIDGGIFSPVIQINLIIFIFLLLHEKIMFKKPIIQLIIFIIAIFAINNIFNLAMQFFFGLYVPSSSFVYIPTLAVSFLLVWRSKPVEDTNLEIHQKYFAAFMLIIILILASTAIPSIAKSWQKSEFEDIHENFFYFKSSENEIENKLQKTGELEKYEKVKEDIYFIETKEPYTIREIFQVLNRQGINITIYLNASLKNPGKKVLSEP